MRSHERTRGLLRAPKLAWDALVRGRYAFTYDQMPMSAGSMSWQKRVNLVRSGGNLLYRRPSPWSMPLHMQFELTNYCDLRCPVCPTGSRSMARRAHAMDPDLFSRVFDETGPSLLTASLWGWGEPLLHPRLGEILCAARKHDVITLLSTNGQALVRQSVLDALIRHPPSYLVVAFDGLTDETNSVYRVGARIAPILDGVKMLAEMKRASGATLPVLNMRFILMKHNQHELPELDAFAARHGFEMLSVRDIFFIDSTSDGATAGRLAPDESGCARAVRDKSGGTFVCQEPFWFPTVFSDGSLVLCEQDYNAELSSGRIGPETSFRELWFGRRAARLRRTIRNDRMNVSFCRNCPYAERPVSDFNVAVRNLTAR